MISRSIGPHEPGSSNKFHRAYLKKGASMVYSKMQMMYAKNQRSAGNIYEPARLSSKKIEWRTKKVADDFSKTWKEGDDYVTHL